MLETGDVIVHPRYGLGKVVGTQMFVRNETERLHYCIEIAGNVGMLYIPQDAIDAAQIRYALDDTSLIEAVMENAPEVLDDNHQIRRTNIEKLLKSGNPRDIVQALRDLTWRQRISKLTGTDERQRATAQERLVNELTLSTTMTVEKLRARINHITDEAMNHHLARQGS